MSLQRFVADLLDAVVTDGLAAAILHLDDERS